MLVRNWMSKKVIAVDENSSMEEATALMNEHHIRVLPVLDRGKLVGVVADRDLKRAAPSDTVRLEKPSYSYILSNVKVGSIMTRNPITVPLNFSIEETAEVLLKHRITGVPVVDDKGEVVGMITLQDLLRVIISLTGVGKRGVQFAFQMEDRPGSIKEVTDILRGYGCRLVSILSSYENAPAGRRNVYVRVYEVDRGRMLQMKRDLKGKATILYVVDHRENKREIYLPTAEGPISTSQHPGGRKAG
jgi:acetoin utilization protein AcuB